ncbi:MAG: CRISPR-associated endonuclease Cas2 [Candidatus Omnitrophica bacterium]|nr:CRISPR-associated endonuclease Cas2 [Candidatus Omnitrophota bacterium]
MSYIIIFDIKKEKASLRVKVNRLLNKMKAKMVQDSVWESDNLSGLKSIYQIIRSNGGKAIIFDKKHALK